MELNSQWVLHHIFQRHCDEVVMCCCILLPLTSVGESHSSPHSLMVCAMLVILAIDCRVLSPHYWEWMEHHSEWVLHPHILQQHCDKVVMCCSFLLPSTSVGESPSLPHAPMVCNVGDSYYWLLCFVSSLLGMNGKSQRVSIVSPHLPATLALTNLLCVAVFSFLPPQRVSPPLYHVSMVYGVSVILSIDFRVFSSLLGMHGT